MRVLTKTFSVSFTPQEAAELKAAAYNQRLDVSKFVRFLWEEHKKRNKKNKKGNNK